MATPTAIREMLALAEEQGFKVFNGTGKSERHMRHAGDEDLDRIEPLLQRIRAAAPAR